MLNIVIELYIHDEKEQEIILMGPKRSGFYHLHNMEYSYSNQSNGRE